MNADARRLAVLGGRGIPFARQNGPYAQASNQDMLIATLDAVAKSFELEGEVLGEVAAGAVLKHSRDFDLTREAVLGSRLAAETPAYDVQKACGTGLGATVGGGGIAGDALTLREVQIDRERLAAYHRLCGFAVTNQLAPTYPHMLAFPLHLALMTRGDFPFATRLIHTANHIVQHRRIDAGERLSLRVWSGPVEPHPRGRQFSIHTEARARDEVLWAETSTNLKRGDRSAQTARAHPPSADPLPGSATWRLKGDLRRRYAAVSGDRNPIHLHPVTARLFGFSGAIAHGMWTKARCLAALGPELPEAFTVRVAFQAADRAAGHCRVRRGRNSLWARVGVRDAKRSTPHLDGIVVGR